MKSEDIKSHCCLVGVNRITKKKERKEENKMYEYNNYKNK